MASYAEIAEAYVRLREGDAQRLSDRPSLEPYSGNIVRPEGVERPDRATPEGREGVPPRGSGNHEEPRRPADKARNGQGRRKLILDRSPVARSLSAAVATPVPDNDTGWSHRGSRPRLVERTFDALSRRVMRLSMIGAGLFVLIFFVVPKL